MRLGGPSPSNPIDPVPVVVERVRRVLPRSVTISSFAPECGQGREP